MMRRKTPTLALTIRIVTLTLGLDHGFAGVILSLNLGLGRGQEDMGT